MVNSRKVNTLTTHPAARHTTTPLLPPQSLSAVKTVCLISTSYYNVEAVLWRFSSDFLVDMCGIEDEVYIYIYIFCVTAFRCKLNRHCFGLMCFCFSMFVFSPRGEWLLAFILLHINSQVNCSPVAGFVNIIPLSEKIKALWIYTY